MVATIITTKIEAHLCYHRSGKINRICKRNPPQKTTM